MPKSVLAMAAALAAASPAGAAAPAAAQEPPPPAGLHVDRIVVMMRHGVRPPTKAPPMPDGTASAPWPAWPVPPGYLTPHGRAAVTRIARLDRAAWAAAGVTPRRGCPRLAIVADSDQRTIETARAYAAAFAPGCDVAIDHKPQGVTDPRFAAIEEKAVPFDAATAQAAVIAGAGPGGIAGEEARLRPLLARLDAILCAPAAPACGIAREPSDLTPARAGRRPKLTGALDRASTAAQILLLEYAEGKPMAEVGWGRATPADIARLAAFHATEFRLLARPAYIARANLALLTPIIVAGLTAADGAAVTMISGHDTNVANLGGLLDVHWQVPGLAADDPAPGGAIVLQHLSDAAGHHFVRALYRSQTVEQIRTLATDAPYSAVLPIAGCSARGQRGLCTEAAFLARLR